MTTLRGVLTLTVLFVFHSGLFAQDINEAQVEDEPEKVLEVVHVTGYHIKRINAEGPAPVVTFEGADLQQAGFNTLEEAARYLPINYPQSHGMIWGSGSAAFNLRGIGTSATLTLINGLRIAPYGQAFEPMVDVNSIPVSAIERIEILKDGASAIYGADAVAGVVNIILKTDYDGIEASVGYGVSEHGDGQEILADFLAGKQGENGNILFSLSYYDQEPVPPGSRDWYRDGDYTSKGGPNARSTWGSPGSFLRYDNFMIEADPKCGTDPLISSVKIDSWGDAYCTFNWLQYQELLPGQERIGVTLSGRYRFGPGLSFFGDVFYSDSEGTIQQAPAPVPGSPEIPTWFGVPYVPADHPNNPFGTDGEILFRMLDLGNREYVNKAKTWRLVLGLEGVWGKWDWRTSLMGSESDVDTDFHNFARTTRVQQALLGEGGNSGDLWYNPFGYQPVNDPQLIDWLKTGAKSGSNTKEGSADLVFERFFGELPGGPVGVAVGAQYRKQELDLWVDDNLASGDLAGGIGQVPVSADRRIASVYSEFSLPLLESLEAQLAVRYEDYSDFGSTTNPKVALRWQPATWILLRASWSTSFLAPTFNDLYMPAYPDLFEITDTVRCEHTGLPADCDFVYISGEQRGSPDLGPEEGESWFAGLVWEPSFLPDFRFQLDFWKFVHENRIETYWPQLVLDAGSDFGITRAPTQPDGTPGMITYVTAMPYNLDEFQTSGFDTTLLYAWETERAGDFQTSLMHTYIDEYVWPKSVWGDAGVNYAGKNPFEPVPQNRFNFNFSWNKGPHSAAANVHYTGEFEHYLPKWVDGVKTDDSWIVSSHTTLDLQYAYTFRKLKSATFRVGCVNCTDEPPPFMYNSFAPYADIRGRFYYARWRQPFR